MKKHFCVRGVAVVTLLVLIITAFSVPTYAKNEAVIFEADKLENGNYMPLMDYSSLYGEDIVFFVDLGDCYAEDVYFEFVCTTGLCVPVYENKWEMTYTQLREVYEECSDLELFEVCMSDFMLQSYCGVEAKLMIIDSVEVEEAEPNGFLSVVLDFFKNITESIKNSFNTFVYNGSEISPHFRCLLETGSVMLCIALFVALIKSIYKTIRRKR